MAHFGLIWVIFCLKITIYNLKYNMLYILLVVFLESLHYFFLKLCIYLGLLTAKKCSKRFFEKNSRFAHFRQKLSKIGDLAGCVQQSL